MAVETSPRNKQVTQPKGSEGLTHDAAFELAPNLLVILGLISSSKKWAWQLLLEKVVVMIRNNNYNTIAKTWTDGMHE